MGWGGADSTPTPTRPPNLVQPALLTQSFLSSSTPKTPRPRPWPDRAGSPRLSHSHPQSWEGGGCLLRSSLSPGSTAARCPLVATAGTAGWKGRRASRLEPGPGCPAQPRRGAPTPTPGRARHSSRCAGDLETQGPCSVSPRPARQSCLGPWGPSLTTRSGPGTRRSSRAAQRSRSGGSRGDTGERGKGFSEGAQARAARGPPLPSPTPRPPQPLSVPPYQEEGAQVGPRVPSPGNTGASWPGH